MTHRWFYIDRGTVVVPLGPMSMAQAKEYEAREKRLLLTVAGLDFLRIEIEHQLRDPKNAKQLERDE